MLERCSACGNPFGIAEAAPGASTQMPAKAVSPITTLLKLMFVSSNWPRKKNGCNSRRFPKSLKFNLD
jgi:hypothetical protein